LHRFDPEETLATEQGFASATQTPAKPSIDWKAAWLRLLDSEQALDRSMTVDDARQATVFHERALQLAARKTVADAPAPTFPVLGFALAGERYGIELPEVLQVLPLVDCTPVPGGPAWLLGVANLRGEVRSVIDLRQVLGLPEAKRPARGYVLVLRGPAGEVAVFVDELERVVHVAIDELATRDEASSAASSLLRGVSHDGLIVLRSGELLARIAPSTHPTRRN
jgi:purine-binding chemotaxis protein CheW